MLVVVLCFSAAGLCQELLEKATVKREKYEKKRCQSQWRYMNDSSTEETGGEEVL